MLPQTEEVTIVTVKIGFILLVVTDFIFDRLGGFV
jgi:hypothetical protein